MSHARTKGSTRVKVHRELAALLEEELSRRGTSVVPAGEQFGKWKGLRESTDRDIVWPPMVIIMNTSLEQEEDDKVTDFLPFAVSIHSLFFVPVCVLFMFLVYWM
jgi:hypothetical protein